MEGDDTKVVICRVCINVIGVSEKWFSLFMKYEDLLTPGQEQDDIVIADKITALTRVTITEADGLPRHICSTCLLELQDAYNFKRKCEQSDKLLRSNTTYHEHNPDLYSAESVQIGHDTYSDENDFNTPEYYDNLLTYIPEGTGGHNLKETYADQKFDTSKTLSQYNTNSVTDTTTDEKDNILGVKVNFQAQHAELLGDNDKGTEANIKLISLVSSYKNHKTAKFECEHCGIINNSECKLRVHLRMKHNIYECRVCMAQFNSYAQIRSHRAGYNCTKQPDKSTKSVLKDTKLKSSVQYANEKIKKSKAIDLKLECHDCGNLFKSKCKLRVHWHKVHYAFKCPNCAKQFKTYKALQNHKNLKSVMCRYASMIHTKKEGETVTFKCKLCPYSTKTITSIRQHMYHHHENKEFKCDICYKTFNHNRSLTMHKENVHKVDIRHMTCRHCNKVIIGYVKYSYHLRKEHRKSVTVQCDICKEEFTSRESLKNHIAKHNGRKDFKCNQCSSSFYTKQYLQTHVLLRHTNDTYCCSICGYTLNNRYILKRHENKHNPTNVACNICGQFLDNAIHLNLHKQRHLDRNHICKFCNKSFFRRKTLLGHQRKVHNRYISKLPILKKQKEKKISKKNI